MVDSFPLLAISGQSLHFKKKVLDIRCQVLDCTFLEESWLCIAKILLEAQ